MIRSYTSKDKQAVMALLRLNIPQNFDVSEENDFADYLDHHVEEYFVVEENGNIIGAGGINYFMDAQTARISWDMIHPDFQGKGIGTLLTKYRIDQIKKNPGIQVVVVRTTQLAYPFYEKIGFVLEKTEKDYWAKGFDLYYMTLALHNTTGSQD